MPLNIAAGNSSGYNYASGRLDHQAFFKAIRIDQADLADVVCTQVAGGAAYNIVGRASRPVNGAASLALDTALPTRAQGPADV